MQLEKDQLAWLAGIYEGEGSCWSGGARSINVAIHMTDEDIVQRIHDLAGIGSFRGPFIRGTNKPVWKWSASSISAVTFLVAIMPWLGIRRAAKAQECIDRWKNNRTQMGPHDTQCIHGHEMTPENTYPTYGGKGRGCRKCRTETLARFRTKKSLDKPSTTR